jgi:hypothetical protein
MTGLAAADDHGPGFDLPRSQQSHNIGNFIGGKTREQRDPRHHAPGDDKITAVVFLRERIGNDANR